MVSDARKRPWYLDLSAKEMEAVIAAVPALLEVAKAREWSDVGAERLLCPACGWVTDRQHTPHCQYAALDQQHPGWRTWLTVEQEETR